MGGAAGAVIGWATAGRDMPPLHHNIAKDLLTPEGTNIGPQMMQTFKRNASAMADVLNPLVGPVAKLQAYFDLTVRNAIELPSAIMDWSDQLLQSKKHLVQFNGQIARSVLEGERRQIMRNIASGARIGSSDLALQRALDDLKDELQPLKDTVTRIYMDGLRYGVQITQGLYEWAKNNTKTIEGTLVALPLVGEFLMLAIPVFKKVLEWLPDLPPVPKYGTGFTTAIRAWNMPIAPEIGRPGERGRGRP